MAVSIDDIIKKEFSRSLMGYDMQEVDVFLDSIIEKIEKMELERGELVAAMEKLLKRVERLEKASDGEKRAIEGEAKPVRGKLATASAAGPVRVQGTKRAVEDAPTRKEKATAKEPVAAAPEAQPAAPTPVAVQASLSIAQAAVETGKPSFHASEWTVPDAGAPAMPAAQPEAAQPVALEMETGLTAPLEGDILPDLMSDLESALLESSIRPASKKETPVRATDQTRVS